MPSQQKISIVLEAIDNASSKIRNVEGGLSALGRGASRVTSTIRSNALAITGLTSSLGAIGFAAVKSAADMEQNRVAFETMLGSADEARKQLKKFSDFARKTPFELPQVVTGAKQLMAYGIEADNLLPTFESLGNIAAGVGRDKLPQLILAYGQVRAATKLTGAELRQFTEAGVDLLGKLAEQSGKSAAQVKEDMEAGAAPSFEEVQKAIFSMTEEGGKFFNLMERQSETFSGVISNIRDNIGRLGRAIVGMEETGDIREGSIFAVLRDFAAKFQQKLDELIPVIVKFTEKIAENKTIVMALAGAVAGIFVGALVGLALAFSTVTLTIAAFAAAGAGVAATLPFWIDRFKELQLGIQVVAEAWNALTDAIAGVMIKLDQLKQKVPGVKEALSGLMGAGFVPGNAVLKPLFDKFFASGGIVEGRGAVPAVVHGGEMILNQQQQQRLFNLLASGTGNQTTVNLGGITINNNTDSDMFFRRLQQMMGGQVESNRMGVL